MLLSRPASSLRRPLCSPHARFLTTYPRPVPTYVRSWNPTKHTPVQLKDLLAKSEGVRRDTSKDTARRHERGRLRDTQRLNVINWSQDLEKSHAIRRLNVHLRLSGVKKNGQRRLGLWRAYTLAKSHVPTLPSLMPDRAWDALWATEVRNNSKPRSRQSHLEILYRDMASVGKRSTLGQRVAYLESIFLNGKEEEALMEWEKDHDAADTTDASSRQDYKPEHLELGAKLYALAGNADRAREIMEELFDLYPTWDPSVMMAVFRAHTGTNSGQHHDIAKTMYLNIKEKKGRNMTLEAYDVCLVGFLEAQHIGYAKQVFLDMIKDGHLAASFSSKQVEAVLTRLHMLYCLGTDIERMTSIALHAISNLPQPYHSHVFGDWMKTAVVKKAPEAAAQILDMMFNRGYQPETVHFNLFLKALLRTKDEPRVSKAENIGWRMIEEARKSSPKHHPHEGASDIISKKATKFATTIVDRDAARKVPKANVTTFALMMRHHSGNLQWEHVDYLARQLKGTNIQPNASLMNIVMDNYCRKGMYSEAWKTYRSLTNGPENASGVFPDGASIRCLWKILRLALGDRATRHDPDLPTPRQLLAETVNWWARCQKRRDAEQFRMGFAAATHGAMTSLMMHCFSYTQDLAGSLVALHVLRKNFGIFPSNNAASVLQKHAAWVDMHRETDSVQARYHGSRSNKKSLATLGRVYYILMERRYQKMNLTGDQLAHMSEEEVGDLGLNLISEFVRVVLKRSYPPDTVEAMIDDAKQEVGAHDISTGDLDASSVV